MVAITRRASPIQRAIKTVAFDGTAGNGAVGTVAAFTVTGTVLCHFILVECTESLAEAAPTATITFGTASAPTLPLGATNATAIDAGEFWTSDSAPPAGAVRIDAIGNWIIANESFIFTVGAQAINNGTLRTVVLWEPLSADGSLVAA